MAVDSDQLSAFTLEYSDVNVQPTYELPPKTAEYEEACSSLKAFSNMTEMWLNYAENVQRNYFFERMPTGNQLIGVAGKLTKILREKKEEYATLQANGRPDFIQSAILTRQIKQLESMLRRIENYLQTVATPRDHPRQLELRNDQEVITVTANPSNKCIRVPVRAPSLTPSARGVRKNVKDTSQCFATSHSADEAPLANEIRSLKMLFEDLREEVKTLLKDQSLVSETDRPPFEIIHVSSDQDNEFEREYVGPATRSSRQPSQRQSVQSSIFEVHHRAHKLSNLHPSWGTASSGWMKGYVNTEPPCLQFIQSSDNPVSVNNQVKKHHRISSSAALLDKKSRPSCFEINTEFLKEIPREGDIALFNEHVTGAETFKNEPHMSVALPRVRRSVLFDAKTEKRCSVTELPSGGSLLELERDLSTAHSNLFRNDSPTDAID